jgi:hypothetical protein
VSKQIKPKAPVTLADYQDRLASTLEVNDFLRSQVEIQKKEIAAQKRDLEAQTREIGYLKKDVARLEVIETKYDCSDIPAWEINSALLSKIEWSGPDGTCPLCKSKKGPHDHLCLFRDKA